MADEIIVQYRFTDPDTGYTDAIVLPRAEFVAEYGSLTKLDTDKIEAAKAERVANWRDAVENPPVPEPIDPVVEAEAWAEQIKALDDQRDQLATRLTERVESLPVKDREKLDQFLVDAKIVVDAEAVAEGK